MRGLTITIAAIFWLVPTVAAAQIAGDPGVPADPGTKFGAPPESANELPVLPGDEDASEEEMGISTDQTPPVQEDVIPLEDVPPGEQDYDADEPGDPNVLDDERGNTPQFDRDATPRSTQPERENRRGDRADPQGGLELDEPLPEGGVEADVIPMPDQSEPVEGEPEFPEGRVPMGPPDEVRGEDAPEAEAIDEPAEVQPTIVPDRRFETFDSGMDPIQGGTPEPLESPEAEGARGTPEPEAQPF